MSRYLAWLERWTTPRTFAVLLIALLVLLVGEKTLDFPLSVPFMRRATGYPYLDMCGFCSPSQVARELDAFGDAGRRLQLLLVPTVDVAIPAASWLCGSVGLTLLLRGREGRAARWLRLLPLAALALDLTENAGIVALVEAYPARLDALATVTGIVTGLKFIAYLSVVVALVALGIARLQVDRLRRA